MSAAEHRRAIDARVAAALTEDPGLRQRLLANPREVLGGIIGVSLPEQVSVHVHEESLTALHLVIPASNDQLTEADLDLASGGTGICSCGCSPEVCFTF